MKSVDPSRKLVHVPIDCNDERFYVKVQFYGESGYDDLIGAINYHTGRINDTHFSPAFFIIVSFPLEAAATICCSILC
jgi:hypothetical protein